MGTYLWSFSVYCETEEETKKDRLPKDERVPVPGVETRQSGGLRSDEHIPMETVHAHPANLAMRARQDGQRNPGYSMTPVGRRVAPARGYDDANG